MAYQIEVAPRAQRELKKLPKTVQVMLAKEIDTLATDPYPSGVEKIAQVDRCYRVRQGDYRIIYVVHDARLIVLVVRVGNRREVYKNLPALKKLVSEWERK
jgi:mRNA interferase RelE/StbE